MSAPVHVAAPLAVALAFVLIAARLHGRISAPTRHDRLGRRRPHENDVEAIGDTGGRSITIAGRSVRVRPLRVRPLGVVAIVGLIALVGGPFPAALVLLVGAVRPAVVRRRGARSRRREIETVVPDTIDLLVLMIHAGLTPHQAIHAMAEQAPPPTRTGFVDVVRRLHRGERLGDALGELVVTCGRAMSSVADTLAISIRHGSPIADALVQLSLDSRERRRRLAEADARRLPVRLSFPLVCCTLPSFVLVAIAPAVLAALSSLGDTSW